MSSKKSERRTPSRIGGTAPVSGRERRLGDRAGWIALAVGLVAVAGLVLNALPGSDVRTKAERYLAYYGTYRTRLTPDQQAIKNAALGEIPAPCCREFPMATCCCPCNLAKTTWGLASHLVAERGYGAPSVREEVERWLAEINPNGAAGDACAKGRCERPFHEDGCGGMKEGRLS